MLAAVSFANLHEAITAARGESGEGERSGDRWIAVGLNFMFQGLLSGRPEIP